jgi:hypothetical protein
MRRLRGYQVADHHRQIGQNGKEHLEAYAIDASALSQAQQVLGVADDPLTM